MRALSLTQPWPWIILNLDKDVENRVWSTKHRGPFLLHAAKGSPERAWFDAYQFVADRIGVDAALSIPKWRRGGTEALPLGGVVGVATIHDVIAPCAGWIDNVYRNCSRVWHMHDQHGFLLRDVRPLAFLAVPGRQRWFNVKHPDVESQ